MKVALSGVDELGISGDIPVLPCPIRASPIIGQSAGAKDIVESGDRDAGCVTEESGLPGFCDYYVIGQFYTWKSIGKDAGTEYGAVVVGNRVIDKDAVESKREDTSSGSGLIAGDEILDDQSLHIIRNGDATSLTASLTWHEDTISLNDTSFDDRGCSPPTQADASSTSTHVVGDYIVEDFDGTNPYDEDSTTSSDVADIIDVAGDGIQLY